MTPARTAWRGSLRDDGAAAGSGRSGGAQVTAASDTHGDAARLAAIEAGLPPDVHDPDTVAAYQALQQRAANVKAGNLKPTRKGGS